MIASTDSEKQAGEVPGARAFQEEIRQGVRTADASTIRAARALEAMDRSRVHRDLGAALLGDASASLGLAPRRAREMLDLGRALVAYRDLEGRNLAGESPLEKVIAIAPAMLARRMEIREWLKVIRTNDARALRRISQQETRSRDVDGVRYTSEFVDLSPIGRAMLFDAQAMFSRLRESAGQGAIPAAMTLPRSDVLAKAIAVAIEAVEGGAVVFDVAAELARPRKAEIARLTGVLAEGVSGETPCRNAGSGDSSMSGTGVDVRSVTVTPACSSTCHTPSAAWARTLPGAFGDPPLGLGTGAQGMPAPGSTRGTGRPSKWESKLTIR